MVAQVDVGALTFEQTKRLKRYLGQLIEQGGSDLHVKAGATIRGRIQGEIISLGEEVVTYEEALELAKELLRTRFAELVEQKSIDFTFKLDEAYRFRVNLFFQVEGVSGVFRVIPAAIPTLDSLNLPAVIQTFCTQKRGLVLVTGPTGSGKTTTLASIINHINQQAKKHIITIEDPVEFVYKDQKSIINQRAIGQDALDFSSALRAALREDPDVILVGEMRDLVTIETALHAAETGHLVLSTLHTVDAKETINRIIGMFPGEEQNRIKMSLASVLQGVISQRLVRTKAGGRMAAVEILVKNARVESLIFEGRDSEITDALSEGKEAYGSQSFDQALLDLYAKGDITFQEALQNATSPSDLRMKLEFHDAQSEEEGSAVRAPEEAPKKPSEILKLKEN